MSTFSSYWDWFTNLPALAQIAVALAVVLLFMTRIGLVLVIVATGIIEKSFWLLVIYWKSMAIVALLAFAWWWAT